MLSNQVFVQDIATTSALIKVTDDIRQVMDIKQLTILLIVDFGNASNNVDYDIVEYFAFY